MNFPSLIVELVLHARILADDPVATAQVFKVYVPQMIRLLRQQSQDPDELHDAAIEALFFYLNEPGRFDPQRGRLSTYLMQKARKVLVDLYRSRTARERRDERFGLVVELGSTPPNEEMERRAELALLRQRLEALDLSARDQRALRLILEGERSTRVLAEALGVKSTSEEEIRREVKRHRDRLMKMLERLGKEDSDDDES